MTRMKAHLLASTSMVAHVIARPTSKASAARILNAAACDLWPTLAPQVERRVAKETKRGLAS